jgi:hypothetical protein
LLSYINDTPETCQNSLHSRVQETSNICSLAIGMLFSTHMNDNGGAMHGTIMYGAKIRHLISGAIPHSCAMAPLTQVPNILCEFYTTDFTSKAFLHANNCVCDEIRRVEFQAFFSLIRQLSHGLTTNDCRCMVQSLERLNPRCISIHRG